MVLVSNSLNSEYVPATLLLRRSGSPASYGVQRGARDTGAIVPRAAPAPHAAA